MNRIYVLINIMANQTEKVTIITYSNVNVMLSLWLSSIIKICNPIKIIFCKILIYNIYNFPVADFLPLLYKGLSINDQFHSKSD